MRFAILAVMLAIGPTPALAFERITDAREFTQLVEGRDLTRFGIRLQVSAQQTDEGAITGRGFGYDVTGDWQWNDGYFCRDLDWGGDDLGFNCQAVLRDGQSVRFVSDRGEGDHADFSLR
ncbi:MAG: hypothetical protein HLUCCA12_05710 [Rhodobacteraceae bacterium HLUCCA12]|nr:MAG: hypothetical protein HLUCCA12_05710 [Rhodobacteraceae bacterium HLUCCA12]